jgi:hypothetical protein
MKPVIARVEQAGYDVLFNKKHWKKPCRERRDVWKPLVATLTEQGKLKVTKGKYANFTMSVLDPFGAFPFDAGFQVKSLPPGVWSKWPQKRPLFTGGMELVEE